VIVKEEECKGLLCSDDVVTEQSDPKFSFTFALYFTDV